MKEFLLKLISLEAVAIEFGLWLKNENARQAPYSKMPVQSKMILTASDQLFLKKILPKDFYIELFSGTLTGLYMATFILRHRMVTIATIIEQMILKKRNLVADATNQWKAVVPYFGDELFSGCIIVENMMSKSNLDFEELTIGISALGTHVAFKKRNCCGYFEPYESILCHDYPISLRCKNHEKLNWWRFAESSLEDKTSEQGKMILFYANLDNISSFDEAELKTLVGKFWGRYSNMAKSACNLMNGELTKALNHFKYTSIEALLEKGMAELRRRYADHAYNVHPDYGGENAEFVALHEYYKILKSRFEL